jgi:DNA modification methylase
MKVELHLGDCLDILQKLPRNSVDAIITDPPYGLNDGKGKVTKRGNELVSFNAGEWDNELPLTWIKEASLIVKNGCWVLSFTDKLSVKDVWQKMVNVELNPKHTFYWIKNNPPPQPRKNFASGVETAVVATKGAVKKWNGGGWELNYFFCPIVANKERTLHPTQKPVSVMKYLINILTEPGDTILDPFMGSGSTGVACMQTGRNFIGIEVDPVYFAIAKKRIEESQKQLLFEFEVSR